jgi:hypothetical protein
VTIFARVATALDTLSPAVEYGMGTYLGEDGALPDYYLVYQLISGVPGQHADDEETERNYRIQVTHWKRSGLEDLADVDAAMKAAGGVKSGEHPLARDNDTGHFGLAVDYIFQET